MDEEMGLLVKQEKYLEAGLHIGTKIRSIDMVDFIYKMRDDGLYILDVRKTDERLRTAAKILSNYKPEDILVVASRVYSGAPASKLSNLIGTDIVKGRFVPGTLTNIRSKDFREATIIFLSDPKGEQEALSEAVKMGIPVIALCDTDNSTKFIDFVIPTNNKGKKALALIFYILTRELMMAHGKIKNYKEFKYSPEDFEKEEEEKE